MAVPTNRVANQVIASADINAIATLANTNETRVATKATRALTKRAITTSYTLVAADAVDMIMHSTSATAIEITLPQDSVATISHEVAIPWRQYGAGQLTFVAGPGATLVSRGAIFKSAAVNAEGYVTKVANNTWVLSGDIVA